MAVPADLRVDLNLEPCDAACELLEELALFASPTAGMPVLRIWQPRRVLMATVAESHLPAFAVAVERACDRGLAVHVRRSGGGSVCLGPGTLVVSHLYDSASNDLDASYRDFAAALLAAAADLGIALCTQEVGSAYCNGRFDLAWRSLKVGGIAQRRRVHARTGTGTGTGTNRIWIHAVLAVDAGALRYPEAVAEFQSDLELPRVADARSTTCLSECLPRHLPAQGLLERCGEAIERAFRVTSNRRNPPTFAEQ